MGGAGGGGAAGRDVLHECGSDLLLRVVRSSFSRENRVQQYDLRVQKRVGKIIEKIENKNTV